MRIYHAVDKVKQTKNVIDRIEIHSDRNRLNLSISVFGSTVEWAPTGIE